YAVAGMSGHAHLAWTCADTRSMLGVQGELERDMVGQAEHVGHAGHVGRAGRPWHGTRRSVQRTRGMPGI
ncbi:MAG: hypothetical protein QME82_09315, partial [Bacillota bacterium]|nr:hypothetical protein [Bacillota bacterium]